MNTLKKLVSGFVILFSLFLSSQAVAQDKIVRLTSLEWPPYTGAALKDQGASAVVAKEAFKAMGYTLIIEFYPWSRAVNLAKDDAKYMGYFPEYASEDIAKEFLFSDPMGVGPLGFAERIDNKVSWSKIDDLSKYRIGVVQDYVNTTEFDQKVAKKQLRADVAPSDVKNLQKLDSKRIDLAVVDRNVFDYLLKNTRELDSAKKTLQFNGKILEDKALYICFKKGPEGERLAKIFKEGVKKVNVAAIMAQYFK